jgi:hypothetical protein
MTASADELFSEIVNERGGVDALNAVQLSIARSLAITLSEETVNAATVTGLTQLLPAPQTGTRVNLRKLSDRDLAQLEKLVKRASAAGSVPDKTEAANAAAWEEANKYIGELQARLRYAELRFQKYERKDATTWRARCLAAESEASRLRAALEAVPVDRPAAAESRRAAKDILATGDNVVVIKPQRHWSELLGGGDSPAAPSDPAYTGDGGSGRGRP